MSAFGSGSNSNGNFWYGNSTNFPGFLYKKNLGVGGRRSTKMGPGGNITCNSSTYLYNKYKPGQGGVGASSTANRRAKNRLATICNGNNNCFPCYNSLGQYSNYTHNPNGFVPCPGTINIIGSNGSVTPKPTPPTPSGTYTVTYLGNTNTGGTAPVDGNSPYNSGTSVTILGNSGSPVLTKSGGFGFAGWNTAPDGSGINYVGGNTFNITQNTILYANWIFPQVRLRYNAGTGGSGTAPSSSGTYYNPFSTQPIVGNTGSFTRSGFTFAGWNTAINGTGTSYPVGSNIIMPSSGIVDLYAQWIPAGGPFTLTYAAGTGGTGSPPAPVTSYSAGSPANVIGNTGSFTNAISPVFNGWNTAANGSGTSYPAGSKITMTANTTLFAQWGSNPPVTVTYDANGGSGTIPTQTYPTGAQATILGQSSLTRPGYSFLGWNTAQDGTGSVYIPGSSVAINSSITLYAQWAPGTVIKDCGSFEGGFSGSSIFFTGSRTVYRDTTNNTITITIPTYYSGVSPGPPYGTGNGPTDTGGPTHSGNLKSSYATATISQVSSVYQIAITYTTAYTGASYTTQTSPPLSFGSTYWPTGQTISSVTYYNSPSSFTFNPTSSGTVTQPGTNNNFTTGCFGGGSYSSPVTTVSSVASFYINFSNGTTTRVSVGTLFQLNGTGNPYTYVFNYARAELANGPTPSPITGTFTPTASTFINTPNV
jgi:uncharacterized repeat protein (TIGR02543 family)